MLLPTVREEAILGGALEPHHLGRGEGVPLLVFGSAVCH